MQGQISVYMERFLPALSKIFENIMQGQISVYMERFLSFFCVVIVKALMLNMPYYLSWINGRCRWIMGDMEGRSTGRLEDI